MPWRNDGSVMDQVPVARGLPAAYQPSGNGIFHAAPSLSARGLAPHRQVTEFGDLLLLKFRDCLDPIRFREGKGDFIAGMHGV